MGFIGFGVWGSRGLGFGVYEGFEVLGCTWPGAKVAPVVAPVTWPCIFYFQAEGASERLIGKQSLGSQGTFYTSNSNLTLIAKIIRQAITVEVWNYDSQASMSAAGLGNKVTKVSLQMTVGKSKP